MGVEIAVLRKGNGINVPKKHDEIAMEYTGWLYDEDKMDKKGNKFDTSIGRGDLITEIGVGRVIRGWDEGILAMSLGEKATLTITPDYGYGARGFPGHIPPNSVLVFDIELKAINGTRL
ncbi:hypothetical protein GRF29_69g1896943 [Pseudopithomyces chartarum]|uniref:peptidylprolyl isomerase n=1 Tax=Pseudopithomyces chartarum TaxID=1892770 RepID=A0AAN6RHE0_9PLEO|nr:hypothetical protein GRF29_69g1896943 [Pseudopithomyces chartarum]